MSRSDRIMVAAGGSALILLLAAAAILLAPAAGETARVDGLGTVVETSSAPSPVAAGSAPAATTIVVDVQGAVVEPGVQSLRAGSRVADAVEAAGGYAQDADLAAAAAAINLAEPLTDGAQIRVPRLGESQAAAASAPAAPVGGSTGGDGGAAGGLVDLNMATPEQLEALPGIGPVTVQKIVAARREQPFASLEDAVQRGVIDRGQLEDIQGLATAG